MWDDYGRREQAWYDTAQVCINGHLINSSSKSSPDRNERHCGICGAATVTTCAKCNADIRGYHHVPGVIAFGPTEAAAHCHECGQPYPWTKQRLDALSELVELLEIDSGVKDALKADLQALTVEVPRSNVAAARMSTVLQHATPELAAAIKNAVGEVATASVKKALGIEPESTTPAKPPRKRR